ncbi:conserved hypothetical protein [Leishmania mexicana MHOM/GT/2001/U1103]|uniref:Uncharacterized protein n=1 Tax=Leishmania mexicana (strain MHOM/GT/2001/U1103) TaxID=929439 RepID=E9ARS0_LEIMU|nr:conserved hypothetical protein [Leishmania mexicana MHOM/GT/2001/U1103]CBZ25641.1 conserved hypothetical protein [Leishmania mexicana MHOM/GT/2001/U1103]
MMPGKDAFIIPLQDADPRLFGSPADRSSVDGGAAITQTQRGSPSRHGAAMGGFHLQVSQEFGAHDGYADPLAAAAMPPPSTQIFSTSLGVAGQSYVSEASLDFQRRLLQQQVQQAHRETERLKAELQETNSRLVDTRQQLNEQKAAYTSLTHRYSTTVEKLTSTESDVKTLEEHLVKERNQRHQVQKEREEQRLALREAEWAQERLQRRLLQLEASKGLDPKEVQLRLEDRSHFIPTVEVRRIQTEMHNTHQALVDRLLTSLESLTASSEESQTNFFVARSSVLSAATDVDARLKRAEAALDDVDKQWTDYRDGVERETHEFLLAVMSENKDLWQQLTLLQNEHAVVLSEMKLRSTQGGSVPMEEHAYVQRQLETMTERLGKAQQLVESQTVLARAHEAEMVALLEANGAMQRQLEELERQCTQHEQASSQKTSALTEADAALHDAASQIEELHNTLREERLRAEAVVAEMKATQRTMQDEYDARVRELEHDCEVADDTATTLQHRLEETVAKLDVVERNLQARSKEYEAHKVQTAAEQAAAMGRHRDDLQRVRAVMEEELASLRAQLDEAQEAARAAVRESEETAARESAALVEHRTAQRDLTHMQEELERLRGQYKEAVEQRQRTQVEADQLRAASGEGSTLAQELQRRCDVLDKEKAELVTALASEKSRQEQRYATLHADWKAAEKALALIHEEVKTLRTRCAEVEKARMAEDRQTQDKEQLMRENIRLHEQYQLIQKECTGLREEVKALKQRAVGDAQWHRQMEDLQRRLRELPELRQAAEAARRDALKAKEETELLRRERDQLSKKLDAFLEDAKLQARREDDFERVCREASAAAQRIGGQVSSAKENSARYHVFCNTNPTGRCTATREGVMAATGVAPASSSAVPASPAPAPRRAATKLSAAASPSRTPQSMQHRSPVRTLANAGGHSNNGGGAGAEADGAGVRPSTSSPFRPWR